jgi:hypothetical protein
MKRVTKGLYDFFFLGRNELNPTINNHQFYQKIPEIETKPSPNWCFILTVTTFFRILTTLHCPVLTDISPGAGKLKPSDTCSAAQMAPGRSRTLFHFR